MRLAFAILFVLAGACDRGGKESAEAEAEVRLWHTFQPHEAEALGEAIAGRGVEVTLLPFARGMVILRQVLSEGRRCPDLVRIDATWLPGLVEEELVAPVPRRVFEARDWRPEAAKLAHVGGEPYGLPHLLDGLALLYRPEALAGAEGWPPESLDALLAGAQRRRRSGEGGIDVRVDGYWFLAFLHARGGRALDPETGSLGIDSPIATRALSEFAALFSPGGPAPRPPPPGEEARSEIRRFRSGEVPVAITGPWAAYALSGGDLGDLAVAPFPRAPGDRAAAPGGGTLFVVPRCARAPGRAWELALDLTAPARLGTWGRRFGVVPATRAGLAEAGQLSRDFAAALKQTLPLPRHPVAAEMFDDLTPAVAAVVAGDATSAEALAGVARAWVRLLERHGIEAAPRAAPARDAGAGATDR